MHDATCGAQNCERRLHARGWCAMHYQRWRQYGDPLAGPAIVTECLRCGSPTARKVPNGPSPSYCSPNCRSMASYERRRDEISARKREGNRVLREATVKVCPQCSADFSPALSMKQRFCSEGCGRRWAKANNSKRCSIPDCGRAHRARGLCMKHYNETHGANRSRKGLPETRKRNLRIKTQRRRALMRDPSAEKVDRDVVGERDGWKCGICRKRVDNSIPWPNPLSPSLDHIVPLSRGGDHTYANSRISHLVCNMQRSNRGGGEQLALIG